MIASPKDFLFLLVIATQLTVSSTLVILWWIQYQSEFLKIMNAVCHLAKLCKKMTLAVYTILLIVPLWEVETQAIDACHVRKSPQHNTYEVWKKALIDSAFSTWFFFAISSWIFFTTIFWNLCGNHDMNHAYKN